MAPTEDILDIPSEIAQLMPETPIVTNDNEDIQDSSDSFAEEATRFDLQSSVKDMAIAAEQIPNAELALNGLFRHPPEFTVEEWRVIALGLQANLPLYAIAQKVHCSRHFLSKKIQENQGMVQMLLDARETLIDIAETQLQKAAQSGSVSASIYILDHLGKGRGWGEQTDTKDKTDDIQIVFGDISDKDLKEAKSIIETANKKTTPTLAGELAGLEIPKPATAQELAVAEDMVNAIKNIAEQNTPQQSREAREVYDVQSQPPYTPKQIPNSKETDDKYAFWENAFTDSGDTPFNVFDFS